MKQQLKSLALALAFVLFGAAAFGQGFGPGALYGPIPAPLIKAQPWTPTDQSGAALSFSNVNAHYDRIGNLVFAYFSLIYPTTASAAATNIGSLPFAAPNQTYAFAPKACWVSGGSIAIIARILSNSTNFALYNQATGANATNTNLSTLTLQCLLIYPAS